MTDPSRNLAHSGSQDSIIRGIADVIAKLELTPSGERFIEGRYPYTYGWDYFRSHAEAFGWPDGSRLSRSEVAGWMHDTLGEDGAHEAAQLLADAYLREWRIQVGS